MRHLILQLTGSPLIRRIVKFLRLHRLANQWLHWFPVVKTLPDSGVRYRARRVESLGLSAEMFDRELLYTAQSLPARLRTFADLGCNAGYFTCWLCDRMKNPGLKGLMIDANTAAVADARWHVQANHWPHIIVLEGIVGQETSVKTAGFYVHISNVCSTTVPPETVTRNDDTWTRIQAPCINVEENWVRLLGPDEPCDLLKIDVEGAELDFFRRETIFLKRVSTILVEWHKYRVSRAELEACLTGQGFTLKSVLHEHEGLGTAVFQRR